MLTPVETFKCKYYLPCGHCDKFDKKCTHDTPLTMTLSGSKDSITVEEFLEQNKQMHDEENFELLKKLSNLNASDYAFNTPACEKCPNNPKNGGSGICNCTVPYYYGSCGFTYGTNTTTTFDDYTTKCGGKE